MRILDRVVLTQDEEYNPARRIGELVESWMRKKKLDTYNHQYIVRVTIDKIDDEEDE